MSNHPKHPAGPLRLHLGCGSYYLPGYVNIDLPAHEHTVGSPKPDIVADFRTLKYEPGSVDEIRCHHVFEHFTRAQAIKLLLQWRRWLSVGGTIHIETPDFYTASWYYVLSGAKARAELERHVFGSQEAGWANHYDGWSRKKFVTTLKALGFTGIKVQKRSNSLSTHFKTSLFNWLGLLVPNSLYRRFGWNKLPNITVIAKKSEIAIDERAIARRLLANYLVGTEGEKLLEVWLNEAV